MNDIGTSIRKLVTAALEEDYAREDFTTGSVITDEIKGEAVIIAGEEGVLSGQACAGEVFKQLDGSLEYAVEVEDGERAGEGEVISRVRGALSRILMGERTALNFLQHLSGVATLTARFVKAVSDTGVNILDTRKTIPGFRLLEKRAVVHGGGINHRGNLKEMILVKENHITAAGGLDAVLDRLDDRMLRKAEIEVCSMEQLQSLKNHPPGRIMLDNFSPVEIGHAVSELNSWGSMRPEIEVSGGITLNTVKDYARPGVDYISVGALTSSAKAMDLSLMVEG